LSRWAYLFLNKTQWLKHTCVDSYPRPNPFKKLFAWSYDFGSVLCSGKESAKIYKIEEKAELLILYSDFIWRSLNTNEKLENLVQLG
jgi:hypothetical protein